MHEYGVRYSRQAQSQREKRRQNHAAPDAEKAREKAGAGTETNECRDEFDCHTSMRFQKKEKPRNRCFGLRCLNQKVRWSRPGRKSDQANACPIHYRPSVEATLLSEHRLGTLEPLKETPRRAESLYEKKRTGRQAAVRFFESVRRRLLRRIVRRQCFAAPAVQVRHPVGADRLFRILRELPV